MDLRFVLCTDVMLGVKSNVDGKVVRRDISANDGSEAEVISGQWSPAIQPS